MISCRTNRRLGIPALRREQLHRSYCVLRVHASELATGAESVMSRDAVMATFSSMRDVCLFKKEWKQNYILYERSHAVIVATYRD